jgi:hypothetical protein
LLLGILGAFGVPALARTLRVRCHRGETLTAALVQAAPGDTLRLTGQCTETVLITTDNLTLTSTSGAIIDGQGAEQAVLTIDGARRVTLQGVTVQHGLYGVLARGGASVSLTGVTAIENTAQGLRIDENSTALLTDCSVANSGGSGIWVLRTSSATFQGMTSSRNNGGNGIRVANTSSALFLGTISSQDNGGNGIGVDNTSNAVFDNATVTTHNNTVNGIDIREASGVRFTNTTHVEAKGNQGDGLQLGFASHAALYNTTTFSATENNGRGIAVVESSSLLVSNSTIKTTKNLGDGIAIMASSMEVETSTISAIDNDSGIVVMNAASLLVESSLIGVSTIRTAKNFFSGIVVLRTSLFQLGGGSTVTSEANGGAGIEIAQLSVGFTLPLTRVVLQNNV